MSMRVLAPLLLLSCGDRDPDDAAASDGPCLLVQESSDYYDDGVLDRLIVHTYDRSGRRVTTDEDHDTTDGVVDWRFTYLYDAHGLLVVREYDDGAEGNRDSRNLYTHDEAGRVVLDEYEIYGNVQAQTRFVYDEGGHLLAEEELNPYDGSVVGRSSYLYDAAGALIQIEHDWNADGTASEVTDYLYAGPGWCAGYVRTGSDGEVNAEQGYSIDEAGDAVLHNADSSISTTYRYDARGHVYEIDSVSELTHDLRSHTDLTWDCPAKPQSECLLSWPTCEPDGAELPLLPRCGP